MQLIKTDPVYCPVNERYKQGTFDQILLFYSQNIALVKIAVRFLDENNEPLPECFYINDRFELSDLPHDFLDYMHNQSAIPRIKNYMTTKMQ